VELLFLFFNKYKIDTKLNKDGINTLSDVQFSHDLMQIKEENPKYIKWLFNQNSLKSIYYYLIKRNKHGN